MEQMNLLDRIFEKYPKMSKGHKSIADFVVDHMDEATFLTAAKIGQKLGVSESTVVRFATAIGYDGFPAFQSAMADSFRSRIGQAQNETFKSERINQSNVLNSVLKLDIANIENTLGLLDATTFDAAVKMISDAEHVYVCGLRSNAPLAAFLHYYLNMVKGNAILLNTTSVSETFEQMMHISKKDVFIGISFPRYSMRTLKAMELASDRNAKVIALTDNVNSPMCLYSSCNLLAQTDSLSIIDSLVAPMSVIQALVVALCLKNKETVKNNLKLLQDTWNNYQVYINDEIDFMGEDKTLN
ncbi:MAG: MurR/RpiR family transcriptional regulator [Lachnospiraceae bacterium]|nr:MurR/RpiR family transcriptional regulator [Lachnospiraceae bacterium]